MIQDRHDLLADLNRLKLKHTGDGKAVATELVRRGATCVTGLNTGYKGSTIYECVYFFCKGPWLQHLSWVFPESDAALSRASGRFQEKDGTEVAYIDYTLAEGKTCGGRDTLRERQHEFALSRGGTEFLPKRVS